MTPTQHNDERSSHKLVQFTTAPLNVLKNQIIISSKGESYSYKFDIIFPNYYRHTISEPNTSVTLLAVVNSIKTLDDILGKLQEVYRERFCQYKLNYTRTIVIDVWSQENQEKEIIKEHNRAHRNSVDKK